MIRINIGCGQSPINGWINYDNSISVLISKLPYFIIRIMYSIRLINKKQYDFTNFARAHDIKYGNAIKRLPFKNNTVDVVYSSHMLEHLDQYEAILFLSEVKRVLHSDGIVRIVVPDLQKLVSMYIEKKDADEFVTGTDLAQPKPKTFIQHLHVIFAGSRGHRWLYDGISLEKFLKNHGFKETKILKPGETDITHPGDLDLYERGSVSVYVEARK